MKTRNGFVSNSSSSSFIIAKPLGDAKKVVADHREKFLKAIRSYNLYELQCESQTDEDVLALAEKEMEVVLTQETIFLEYCSERVARILSSVFNEYVLGCVEGGPGDNSVVLVSVDEIETVLKKVKGKQ